MENKKDKKNGVWIIFIILFVLSMVFFFVLPLYIAAIFLLVISLPAMIYILIYKWIGKKFASVVFAFSVWLNILVLIIPVVGGLLALDIMKFSENFSNNPKYVLLHDMEIIF